MSRLRIDGKRVYTAGMSGGARVALIVALGSNAVAGVVASSAGYPDSKPRKTLPFPIFSTAGTDDFNHLEMRRLDEALTTPHRLAVFTGGHTWLSPELATQAVEWLEIRAVHDGIAPRDAGRIDALFERRVRAADGAASPKAAYLSAKAIAEDFAGLKDVSAYAARASQLERDRDVRAALKADRDADNREEQTFRTVSGMERQLGSDDDRPGALMQLRRFWKELSEQAKGPADTADRRIARRVLANLAADTGRTADPDYLKIISEYRLPRVRPPDR
jgi:poly(3-hydroxybutyrate) depolymerase